MRENNILIWGTGKIAQQISEEGLRGKVIGYIETEKTKQLYNGKKVYSIDAIPQEFDYIIVANSYANEIYSLCIKWHINMNKVIFMTKIQQLVGLNDNERILEILGDENYKYYSALTKNISGTSFDSDVKLYESLNKRDNFKISNGTFWPIVIDKYNPAGSIHNYFLQDLWAAKLVFQNHPKTHFDIGSRVDGFIAHILAMGIPVTLIDIRKFPYQVDNLYTIVDDATSLSQVQDESIESMSALCSLEHFGLGRYGDPIDPEACFKCFANIQRKMKKGGSLYISLPIGKERVEFNAHRVFYPMTVIDCFSEMKLIEYSCAADNKIEPNPDLHKYDMDPNNGEYRYGLFWFKKI